MRGLLAQREERYTHATVRGVPPQNRNPQSIGFLLLDNFTLISLASAVEPLRMANQLSGRELYRWHTLSLDGRQVWASDGLQITPTPVPTTPRQWIA